MKKIWIGIIIIAAVALAIVFLVTQVKKESEEIKIGAILPLTGDIAAYGENAKNGIELAVEEINKEGGVNGKKIRVIYEDSQGLPQPGVSAVHKLITRDKVQCIIGDVTSGVTLAAAPVVNKNRVVILSPGASSPDVTDAGDYVFRNWQSDALEAEVMAKYLYENGIKKARIMYINNEFGKALERVFQRIFVSKGGEIAGIESFEQNAIDFRTQLLKLKRQTPEVIYLASYPQETPLILKQARELGITAQFAGVAAFEDESLIRIAGKLAEGLIYTFAMPSNEDDPVVARFKKAYKERYGKDPGLTSDTGYDALKMIVLAIKLGGGFIGDAIKEGLYKIKDYHGASGVMTFDENGDVIKLIGIKAVKNGEFIWLKK